MLVVGSEVEGVVVLRPLFLCVFIVLFSLCCYGYFVYVVCFVSRVEIFIESAVNFKSWRSRRRQEAVSDKKEKMKHAIRFPLRSIVIYYSHQIQ